MTGKSVNYVLAGLIGIELMMAVLNLWLTPSVTITGLLALDEEATLPTWFSSSQLLLMAITAFVISQRECAKRWIWYALAGLFGYLSLDETATIHERFGAAITKQFAWTLWGDYSWLIVFAPLIAGGAGLLLYGAWKTLRTDQKALTLAVCGVGLWIAAIGLEMAVKYLASVSAVPSPAFIPVIEEFCEMCGATLLWAAMLRRLRLLTAAGEA